MQVNDFRGNLLYGMIIKSKIEALAHEIVEGKERNCSITITGPFYVQCHIPYTKWYFPDNLYYGEDAKYWKQYAKRYS